MSDTPQTKPWVTADISECCTCGHKWITGTNGGHSCAEVLSEKLVAEVKWRTAACEAYDRAMEDCVKMRQQIDQLERKLRVEKARTKDHERERNQALDRLLAIEKRTAGLHHPPIFTLCRHCNQEFKLTIQEYASFTNCPHCSKRVDIWLRISPPDTAPETP
jgi:DNA-directed RNA polymerase subunit RPC12/RpoP